MWEKPEQMGLTDQEEIDRIAEELWQKEQSSRRVNCPDCGVTVNHKHENGCDVARCTKCRTQRLSCDCKPGEGDSDIWNGLWPGIETAYKNKLICWSGSEWTFDLNRAAIMDQQDVKEEPVDDTPIDEVLERFSYDFPYNDAIQDAIENLKKVFHEELKKQLTAEQMETEVAQEWFNSYYETLRGSNPTDYTFKDILFLNI